MDRYSEHSPRTEAEVVVPVVREELDIEKRMVETGRVRLTKRVHEHEQVLDEPLLRQEVDVEHVPINKVWDGPPPAPRYDGETLIIPILEEELVVEKRLVLREEVHVRRVRRTVHEPQTVVLRDEEVTVERIEPAEHA